MVRILFLADSHLGFDMPLKPKIRRRRRGSDFFANFRRALEPAFAGQADLVLHGGDLFFRSKVAPVIYPGSIERTSFAERFEEKHYVKLKLNLVDGKPKLKKITFVPLPSRPMVILKAEYGFKSQTMFESWLEKTLANLDPDSVVRIDLEKDQSEAVLKTMTAAKIRNLAPASMNVTLRYRGH